jgi:hypothetical protein
MADESVAPEVTGPIDPGVLGPLDPALQQSIAVANAPSASGGLSAAGTQALSVAPPEYYYLTQLTEKQKAFQKAQAAADIASDVRALSAQREAIDTKIKEKEESVLTSAEYKRGVEEAKIERARLDAELRKLTTGPGGESIQGSFPITTLGIEMYNKDVAAQKSAMTEMQKAIDASESPAARAAAMKNYQDSVNKLDELYSLKPFSPEWKAKYPDVTSTKFFGMGIDQRSGPGREAALAQGAAIRGEAAGPRTGLSAITDASGNYVYNERGQYVGTGSLAYAQSAQGTMVKQAVEADAKVLSDAYARIASDPKSTPAEIESAYQASKSASEIASRTTKTGVVLTREQATGLSDNQMKTLGVNPQNPTLQDIISRVGNNPYDPTITESDRALYGIVSQIKPTMSIDTRANVQSQLGAIIGEKAARDYIAAATQPATGVGSKAWYAEQLTSREAQAKANIVGGITPEGKVITTKPPEPVTPLTSFLPSTPFGQEATTVERISKEVATPGGLNVLGWMGGVKDLAVRMVTTIPKAEYAPVTSIALLPGGMAPAGGPLVTTAKGGTALDAFKAFFSKPLVSAPSTTVTAAAIIPIGATVKTPAITEVITGKPSEVGKRGGVDYTLKEAPTTTLADRLKETVVIAVPEVKIAETGKLDKPFEFTSLTPKNEKSVSGFLDTMNYYTKGQPLSSRDQTALSGMLKNLDLSDRDKSQINNYLTDYQVYAKETQTLQSGLSKIASGDADSSTVNSVASSITKISEYSPDSAKKFNQDFKDYAAIGQINQVLKAPEAKKDWNTTISLAQSYAAGISDLNLKAKYTHYPIEVATYDQSVSDINKAVASDKSLSASEQQSAIMDFNKKIDGLTIIPQDKKQELKSTYASALQVPGLYKEVNSIMENAPVKGISSTELVRIQSIASANPLLNESYEVKDPKTGKTIVDEKTGKPVTSTYAKDMVAEVAKVKAGYITPEEFKATHALGFLTTIEDKKMLAEQEKALGFKPPTVTGYGNALIYGFGYDLPNMLAEKFDWTKSAITGQKSEYKPPAQLTTEAPTLGHGLEYIQPLIKERVFERSLGTMDIGGGKPTEVSIGKTWEGAVNAIVGTQEKVGGSLFETVIKPGFGTTPEGVGTATGIRESGKVISEFQRGLFMSPIEKPVETLASVGVGKVFAMGMPVLESGIARLVVPTAAKVGVGAKTAGAVTKYGLAAALTAPYAIETGGRIVASDRPGYTAGQIVGTELIPMSIGAGLTGARVKEVGKTGIETGRTAIRRVGEFDFGKIFGEKPVTVSRGPAPVIEPMVGSPRALEAQMKVLRDAGTAFKPESKVVKEAFAEQARISDYLSNYREGVIRGATKGAGSADPEFLKLVDEAVLREQARLAKLPPLERSTTIGIPSTVTEIPKFEMPGSPKSMEAQMKLIQERGEAIKAPTEAERLKLREQERLSDYFSNYRDTVIKRSGIDVSDSKSLKLVDEAVVREQNRISKLSEKEKELFVRNLPTKGIEIPKFEMPGSPRTLESQLKSIQESVRAPTEVERLKLRDQEKLSNYLSDYRDTVIKRSAGKESVSDPEFLQMVNDAVVREQSRLAKLSPMERTEIINKGAPKTPSEIALVEEIGKKPVAREAEAIDKAIIKKRQEILEAEASIKQAQAKKLSIDEINARDQLTTDRLITKKQREIAQAEEAIKQGHKRLSVEEISARDKAITDKLIARKQREIAQAEEAIKKGQEKRISIAEINARNQLVTDRLITKKQQEILQAEEAIKKGRFEPTTAEERIARQARIDERLAAQAASRGEGYTFELKTETPSVTAQIEKIAREQGYGVSEKKLTASEKATSVDQLIFGRKPEVVAKPVRVTKYKTMEEVSGAKKLIESIPSYAEVARTKGLPEYPGAGTARLPEYPGGVGGMPSMGRGIGIDFPTGIEGARWGGTVGGERVTTKAMDMMVGKREVKVKGEPAKPTTTKAEFKVSEAVTGERAVLERLKLQDYLDNFRKELEADAKSRNVDTTTSEFKNYVEGEVGRETENIMNKSPSRRAEILGIEKEPVVIKGKPAEVSEVEISPEIAFKLKVAAKKLGPLPETKKAPTAEVGGVEIGKGGTVSIAKVEQKAAQKVEQKVEEKVEQKKKSEVTSELMPLRRRAEIEELTYERTWTPQEVSARQAAESRVEPRFAGIESKTGMVSILNITGLESQVGAIIKQAQKQSPSQISKVAQETKFVRELKSESVSKVMPVTKTELKERVMPETKVETRPRFVFDQLFKTEVKTVPKEITSPKTAIKVSPKEMERQLEILPPRLELKQKVVPPVLPKGDEKPWGWDPLTRERLAMRKIQAPIATGMQLLTGKGLFNIKYNVGIPSKIAARAGVTATKTSPTQISSQFTGERMGLGTAKSSRPTVSEGTAIGDNIGNMLKGVAKPALRKAIKKKVATKRKKR